LKGLSRLHKILFIGNIIAVLLLFLACITPYISNEIFSFLTFLSLIVPLLVLINFCFLFYWVFIRKTKRAASSLLVLVIGYFVLGSFYKVNFSNDVKADDLKVMSFNVRLFNKNGELESTTVFEDVQSFIKKEKPDIICFQEPYYRKREAFDDYPYYFFKYINMRGKGLLGIYSKFPIVNQGMIDLPKTHSNASFADILYQNDTIRVYNVHLESLGITPGHGTLRNKRSDKVLKMLNKAFKKQLEQAKILTAHRESANYKTIFCGDLNNNQFSNTYQIIKGDFQDTFIEEGSGYGRTLKFHGIPMRIDFILADESFEVTSHKNYDVQYSDHYPIMASFQWRTD